MPRTDLLHPEPAQESSRRMPESDLVISHTLAVRVYYEDTDAAGMVYHANYLKFAERGRTEMLRSLGFGHRRLGEETGIGFTVRRCTVDFLVPARLEDALTVVTELAAVGGATLSMRQRIRRGDELIADLDILVACIGRDGRPRRVPGALRAAIGEARAAASATC
jgi:acyl-CoA thioester hydrolase